MVFVDTSALYALASPSDRNYGRSSTRSLVLQREQISLWTATHILQEYWHLLDARMGTHRADEAVSSLLSSAMRITSIEKTDIIRALEISSRYEDQDFSLEDRISFVLMERLGRFQVWTYDHDFAVFRFGADRKQAFEILQ